MTTTLPVTLVPCPPVTATNVTELGSMLVTVTSLSELTTNPAVALDITSVYTSVSLTATGLGEALPVKTRFGCATALQTKHTYDNSHSKQAKPRFGIGEIKVAGLLKVKNLLDEMNNWNNWSNHSG